MMVFDTQFEAGFFGKLEDRVGIVRVERTANKPRTFKKPERVRPRYIDTRARVSMSTAISSSQDAMPTARAAFTFAITLPLQSGSTVAAEPQLIVDNSMWSESLGMWRSPIANSMIQGAGSPSVDVVPAPVAVSAADIAWSDYLERLAKGRFSGKHITFVRDVWGYLRSRNADLPPPQTAPTESGALSMVWDSGEHHVEVTVSETKMIEWFYSNRETGKYEGEEDNRLGSLSSRLTGHIKNIKPVV